MFTGLELPKIMASLRAKKDKTLSTSSVTKYLTINSRTHPRVSLGLGEEESAVDTSSQGSVGEPAPDPPDPHPAREKPATKTVVEVSSISGKERGGREYQLVAMVDDGWRERVLTQKAQALGLLSRDRGQGQQLKKAMRDQQAAMMRTASRPHTRVSSRPDTRAELRRDSRPDTRAELRRDTRAGIRPAEGRYMPHTHEYSNKAASSTSYRQQHLSYRHSIGPEDSTQEKTTSRQRATCDSSAERANEKLEKMLSIYEPASSPAQWSKFKRSPTKQQSSSRSRCETRFSKRPETRCGGVGGSMLQSRPGTRLSKNGRPTTTRRPRLDSDESQYWNEVPNARHCPIPRFRTSIGTGQAAGSRSDDNNIRPMKLYSHTQQQHTPGSSEAGSQRQHSQQCELSSHYRHSRDHRHHK